MTGPIETEIKIPLPMGADEAVRLIHGAGYSVVSPRTLQSDQIYDRSDRSLRTAGKLLRVRSAGGPSILTYKGPALATAGYKSREEIETSFSSSEALEQILQRLGFTPSFRYQKYRTAFQIKGEAGVVCLDETPIGVFLELEGPEYWIDAAALRLGFATKDYITSSYAALYRAHLESSSGPSDMLFPIPL